MLDMRVLGLVTRASEASAWAPLALGANFLHPTVPIQILLSALYLPLKGIQKIDDY
jgi:hypothetical protein